MTKLVEENRFTEKDLAVLQFDREASQTRDYCVAKKATHRAARPDPSLRNERLFRMTIKLHHYQKIYLH
jgi:hypothetical protein